MTDFLTFLVYLLLSVFCIYLGILFAIWTKIAFKVSSVWKYQMALFFALGYSKLFVFICRYLMHTNVVARDAVLKSWVWAFRDIPLLIVIGWFVWEMSRRFFILRDRNDK